MTQAPPLTGQDIGLAANATRKLLDILLDRTGTTFDEWVALRTLALEGPVIPPAALLPDLAGKLSAGEPAVAALLDRLTARGLVQEGFALTADGQALFARLRDAVAGVTARMYGDLDAGDLAVTRRVLAQVTERAHRLRTEL
ncbi:MarR family winged helix-turn-helix transcriptional regulator [Actinomadura scrupuli]|uniref:MarR family winged helix-turn-helix transcriptional regulator n=1 Tax=Actinomadura scrupuli TaxID=559629 RepID=UPI003D976286